MAIIPFGLANIAWMRAQTPASCNASEIGSNKVNVLTILTATRFFLPVGDLARYSKREQTIVNKILFEIAWPQYYCA